MSSNVRRLRDHLECLNVDCEEYLTDIEDEISELEDEIDDLEGQVDEPDCTFCDRYSSYIDPVLLHLDLSQLEVSYTLKEISEEAYLVAKSILEKYVTI